MAAAASAANACRLLLVAGRLPVNNYSQKTPDRRADGGGNDSCGK